MRKFSGLCVLVALVGCGKKDEPAPAPSVPGSAAAPAAPPVAAPELPPADPPPQVPNLPLNIPNDETPNVMHLANKVDGKGRSQEDVSAWLDRVIAPGAKACIAKLPSGSTVQVGVKLGKDGRAGDSTISVKAATGKPDKVDQAVAACIAQVAANATISTPAPEAVTATARFVVQ